MNPTIIIDGKKIWDKYCVENEYENQIRGLKLQSDTKVLKNGTTKTYYYWVSRERKPREEIEELKRQGKGGNSYYNKIFWKEKPDFAIPNLLIDKYYSKIRFLGDDFVIDFDDYTELIAELPGYFNPYEVKVISLNELYNHGKILETQLKEGS